MPSLRKESKRDARALLRDWIDWTEACEMTFPATTFYAAKELLRQPVVTDDMIERAAQALFDDERTMHVWSRADREITVAVVLRAALGAPDDQ